MDDFKIIAINILNALYKYNQNYDPHLFDVKEINLAIKLLKKDGLDDKESGSDSDAE